GLGLGLEPADQQATHLFLDVGVAVGIAQDREVPVHAVDLLGHHVEVLSRVQRHGHAAHRADRLRPLAGAVNHHLGLDVTLVGPDAGHGAARVPDAGHPGTLAHRNAAIAS